MKPVQGATSAERANVLADADNATSWGTTTRLKRPGFPGGSGYWIPIKGWSVRYAS